MPSLTWTWICWSPWGRRWLCPARSSPWVEGVRPLRWVPYAAGMVEGAGRHAALVAELAEWAEDLWQVCTGSRVVLVKVPSGWGRTTVLERFQAEITDREDAPVTLTIRVDGRGPAG